MKVIRNDKLARKLLPDYLSILPPLMIFLFTLLLLQRKDGAESISYWSVYIPLWIFFFYLLWYLGVTFKLQFKKLPAYFQARVWSFFTFFLGTNAMFLATIFFFVHDQYGSISLLPGMVTLNIFFALSYGIYPIFIAQRNRLGTFLWRVLLVLALLTSFLAGFKSEGVLPWNWIYIFIPLYAFLFVLHLVVTTLTWRSYCRSIMLNLVLLSVNISVSLWGLKLHGIIGGVDFTECFIPLLILEAIFVSVGIFLTINFIRTKT